MKPQYFSISRIRCFESCQWAYKLQYVDKAEIKEKAPSTAANFGNLIHHCAEHKVFDPDEAKKLGETIYAPITSEDLNKHLVPNLLATENYVKNIDLQYPEKTSDEKFINWYGSQYNLTSKIDRICQNGNSFKIIDYKTGKNIDKADSAAEQLKFYHLLALFWIRDKLGIATIDSITCELFFTRHDRIIPYIFNNTQIADFTRDIKRRIETIRSTTRFFPNPSRWNCSYCPYKHDRSLCKSSSYRQP